MELRSLYVIGFGIVVQILPLPYWYLTSFIFQTQISSPFTVEFVLHFVLTNVESTKTFPGTVLISLPHRKKVSNFSVLRQPSLNYVRVEIISAITIGRKLNRIAWFNQLSEWVKNKAEIKAQCFLAARCVRRLRVVHLETFIADNKTRR